MGAKLNKLFGYGTMESGYQQELREMSRLVADKCHVTELEFKQSELSPNLVKLPVWAVNDLNEYLSDIHENRDIDYSRTTILLGVDKGQEYIKFTLQVIDNQELELDLKVKYKSTGVNKLHLFALCDKRVPESNYNVCVVFNHVRAHLIKYTLTSDLAMLMKIYGKQQCSCKHSCYCCNAPNDDFLNPDYPLSTCNSAMEDCENWKNTTSGDRNKLKNFHNQEFLPVGFEHMSVEDLEQKILLKTPPPSLHLLLCTNHATKALEKIWKFGLTEWVKEAFQSFKDYFAGTLEGNQCSNLIRQYGILENLAIQHNRPDIMPFVRFFKALNSVKSACFGLKLDPNFEEIIDEFKNALVSLREVHDINVTPKYHMICIHVKQYCQITGDSLKLNEQALESSHGRFKKIVQRFAGKDSETDNPLWVLNVLRAFEVFNSNATFRDSL